MKTLLKIIHLAKTKSESKYMTLMNYLFIRFSEVDFIEREKLEN